MSVPVPDLDDRDFADLVESARRRIREVAPEWTDLSVHDPGIVLVEAFAHLTDLLMYRVNRVPDRLYAVFLNLLGTALGPPAAATTTLTLSRPAAGAPLRVPRGTRVGCPPGLPGVAQPVFVTLADAELAADQLTASVEAADVVLHDAVVVGTGTGQPGQSFTLPGAPLVDGPGLVVAVEVPDATALGSGEAITVGGRTYRTCREVQVFADAAPGEPVVRVDRTAGTLAFAWFAAGDEGRPAVPGPGARVLASYRTGGGERGNVAADQVTAARDPLPGGLRVTNPQPATGGRDAEPLARALRRAPQEFQARDRAVTARDYEVLAARHGGVARAKAMTRREVWAFAEPGEVEVVLVPHVPDADRPQGRVGPAALAAGSRDEVRTQVEAGLRARATIGAEPVVTWGQYKQVVVRARVVVRPDEDVDAVRGRVLARLGRSISPLPEPGDDYASGFGRPLRVSNLYRALEQSEPGVLYVEDVRLVLDQVPDTDAVALVRAEGQGGTWFVGQGGTLFRSTNGGDGWEALLTWGDEVVRAVTPYPSTAPGRAEGASYPGLVAVATDHGDGSRVRVSDDLGGTWRQVAELGFGVADLAWVERSGSPVLLMVGERGLYEISLAAGAVPVQNLVDPGQPDRGFHAVESFVDVRGRTGVVLAAEASAGVYLSADAGAATTFGLLRAAGDDVRCLTVQYDGPDVVLWAGRAVPEGDGIGGVRLRVDELARVRTGADAPAWEELRTGWTGGSCWALRVVGDSAYAATQSGGVLTLPLGQAATGWVPLDVNAGLPLRDRRRFQPVTSLGGVPAGAGAILLAAGPGGVHRSLDGGRRWRSCSAREVTDVVTLPGAWLFCSGEHDIEVVRAGG